MRRLCGLALAGVLLACGCAVPHPKDSHGVTKVAVTEAEAEEIYDRYRAARRDALNLLDDQPLAAVESGPVLAIDAGALMVARRLLLSEAPDDTQSLELLDVYAPRLDSYPLWFVVVVRDGVRDLLKIQVFQRESATGPWRLSASPEMLQRTDLPTFETDDTQAVDTADPADSGGLEMSPQEALRGYATTLNAPDSPDQEVTEDSFVEQMREVADQQRSIEGVTFTQDWSDRPVEYAIRTADGGVVAFGTLVRVDRYQIEEGRYIDWPEGSEQKAFLSGRLYDSGELRYYHQVLMYVPPDDGDPVVLGHYGGVVDGFGY